VTHTPDPPCLHLKFFSLEDLKEIGPNLIVLDIFDGVTDDADAHVNQI